LDILVVFNVQVENMPVVLVQLRVTLVWLARIPMLVGEVVWIAQLGIGLVLVLEIVPIAGVERILEAGRFLVLCVEPGLIPLLAGQCRWLHVCLVMLVLIQLRWVASQVQSALGAEVGCILLR
jgi:hypothetical protein